MRTDATETRALRRVTRARPRRLESMGRVLGARAGEQIDPLDGEAFEAHAVPREEGDGAVEEDRAAIPGDGLPRQQRAVAAAIHARFLAIDAHDGVVVDHDVPARR